MSSAIHTGKAAGHPARKQPVSKRGNVPKASSPKTSTGNAASAAAGAKLRTGTELLTRAMSAYAGPANPAAARKTAQLRNDFRQAYASIIKAVPKENRLDLLQQMKRGIEEVARTEFNVTLDSPVGAEGKSKVATAEFMAGLERQEREQRESDIATGRLLPVGELRNRLVVSPQAVSAALKAKRIFVLQGASGEYLYPAFFAEPAYERRALEKVCKALGDLPGAAKWDFFMSPRVSLNGRTPLQALAKGALDEVLEAANAFREE